MLLAECFEPFRTIIIGQGQGLIEIRADELPLLRIWYGHDYLTTRFATRDASRSVPFPTSFVRCVPKAFSWLRSRRRRNRRRISDPPPRRVPRRPSQACLERR